MQIATITDLLGIGSLEKIDPTSLVNSDVNTSPLSLEKDRDWPFGLAASCVLEKPIPLITSRTDRIVFQKGRIIAENGCIVSQIAPGR